MPASSQRSDSFTHRFLIIAGTIALGLVLASCATIQPYADRAVAERRAMNDSQARLAIDGMCDVAIGGAVREWTRDELALAFLVCNPARSPVEMAPLSAPGAM